MRLAFAIALPICLIAVLLSAGQKEARSSDPAAGLNQACALELNANNVASVTLDGVDQGNRRRWELTDVQAGVRRVHELTIQFASGRTETKRLFPIGGESVVLTPGEQLPHAPRFMPQMGHLREVTIGTFSPDGSLLATGDNTGAVVIWNVNARAQIRRLAAHNGGVLNSLSFSPDASKLLAANDSECWIWRLDDGSVERVLAGNHTNIRQATWSRDGKSILTTGDDLATLWDAVTLKVMREFPGRDNSGSLHSATFNPDGSRLVTGHTLAVRLSDPRNLRIRFDGTLKIWDAKTGNLLATISKRKGGPHAIAIDPSGSLLVAATDEGHVTIADMSGRVRREFMVSQGRAAFHGTQWVGFTNSNSIVISETLGKVTQYDLNGQLIRAYEQANANPIQVGGDPTGGRSMLSPDGSLLAVSRVNPDNQSQSVVAILDVRSGKSLGRAQRGYMDVTAMAFSDSGRLLVCHRDHSVTVCDTRTMKYDFHVMSHCDPIGAVDFSAMSPRFVSRSGWGLILYPPAFLHIVQPDPTGRLQFSTVNTTHLRGQVQMLIDPIGNRLFYGDGFGRASIASMKDGEVIANTGIPSDGLFNQVQALALSSDRKRVAVLADSSACIWTIADSNLATQPELGPIEGQPAFVAFERAGNRLFTEYRDEDTEQPAYALWDSTTRTRLRSIPMKLPGAGKPRPAPAPMARVAPQLNGTPNWPAFLERFVGTLPGGPKTSDRLVRTDPNADRELTCSAACTFPDGAVTLDERRGLALHAVNTTLVLWDTNNRRWIHILRGHSDTITSVAFSPNGRWALSGSNDGTCRLWDLATGETAAIIVSKSILEDNPLESAWAVAMPDGRFDTSNTRSIEMFKWVLASNDRIPVAPEAYLRDYFEPGLLARILRGERLRPLPDLSDLDTVGPRVVLQSIVQGDKPDEVVVTLTASYDEGLPERIGGRDVYDLRLLRNDQLVAAWPGELADREGGDDKAQWRKDARVVCADGDTVRVSRVVKLPRSGSAHFSAYAFNGDRVKGATDRKFFSRPSLPDAKSKAYVLAIGVGNKICADFDDEFPPLPPAALSAEAVAAHVTSQLVASGQYDVVTVPLISRLGRVDPGWVRPDKDHIRGVFDVLAGVKQPDQMAFLPKHLRVGLSQCQPDDLVIIYWASHGLAREGGRYYLMPYDTAPCPQSGDVPADFFDRCVSHQFLTSCLRGLDAEQTTLIIDACYAGAVQGVGFKPAPLGDRNVGQIAFDKRMRVLVAGPAGPPQVWAAGLPSPVGGVLSRSPILDGDSNVDVRGWLVTAVGLPQHPEFYDYASP